MISIRARRAGIENPEGRSFRLPLCHSRGYVISTATLVYLYIPFLLFGGRMVITGQPSDTPTTSVLAYDTSRGGGMYGPTICVDPAFTYYQRPLPELCRRIANEGFTAAQVIFTSLPDIATQRRYSDAFRAAGVAPVLRLYPPTDMRLYQQNPQWRQRMLGGSDGRYDWRVFLCPNQPTFVTEYCRLIEEAMRSGGWSGIQLVEVWFEQWGGPEVSPGVPREHYACLCDACVAKFQGQTGVDPRELFRADSPKYYRKTENRALYAQWVDFRVQSIQDFLRAMTDAVLRGNRLACINIMYLSDARVELDAVREYQACDLNRMVTEIRPHIVTIQDAWQDWIRADLSPNFIADYARAYRDRIRGLHPGVYLMSHADIGSLPASKRSPEWIRAFAAATVESGMGAPSYYEWSVSTLAAE